MSVADGDYDALVSACVDAGRQRTPHLPAYTPLELTPLRSQQWRRAEPDDLVCVACDRVLTMAEYVDRHCCGCGARLKAAVAS